MRGTYALISIMTVRLNVFIKMELTEDEMSGDIKRWLTCRGLPVSNNKNVFVERLNVVDSSINFLQISVKFLLILFS